MINLILFGVPWANSTQSGEKPSERMRRIAENIFSGIGIRGGWFTPAVPYIKDQEKLDEVKCLLEEEVLERARKIWDEMEKKGE